MVANLVVAQEEHTRELPMDPVLFGLVVFVFLLVLVLGVLMFGKGRPHS